MKPTPSTTRAVMGLLLMAAILYEVFSLSGDHATISELVWALSQSPIFTFACGVLCGHFWWQRNRCINCGKSPIWRQP